MAGAARPFPKRVTDSYFSKGLPVAAPLPFDGNGYKGWAVYCTKALTEVFSICMWQLDRRFMRHGGIGRWDMQTMAADTLLDTDIVVDQ